MFRRISQYIADVKGELMKSSFPWDSDPSAKGIKKYRELAGSTTVVLLAMCLLGAYVALFDLMLTQLVAWITGIVR